MTFHFCGLRRGIGGSGEGLREIDTGLQPLGKLLPIQATGLRLRDCQVVAPTSIQHTISIARSRGATQYRHQRRSQEWMNQRKKKKGHPTDGAGDVVDPRILSIVVRVRVA